MNMPGDETLTFYFNGQLIPAMPGQTIGAAILESGERILRQTRFDEKPRGMFCGIGVCFDCLVVIDGSPNQRACLIEVRDGMKIQTQIAAGSFPLETQA